MSSGYIINPVLSNEIYATLVEGIPINQIGNILLDGEECLLKQGSIRNFEDVKEVF